MFNKPGEKRVTRANALALLRTFVTMLNYKF